MTTVTLRPNGNVQLPASSSGGAGNGFAAVSDNSDTTYVHGFASPGWCEYALGTVALPDGAVIKQGRVRARIQSVPPENENSEITFQLRLAGTWLFFDGAGSTGAWVTTTGAWQPLPALTQSQVDGLQVRVFDGLIGL